MSKLFDMDNPLMRKLGRMGDLMAIDILTMVCCLPVFTIGASITAMYTIELRWARGEEGYIVKPFFKAFKENFRQATLEWLIALAVAFIFVFDYMFFTENPEVFPQVYQLLVLILAIVLLLVFQWVFLLQCRFENTIRGTLKNAAVMAVAKAPRTIGMLASWVVAILLLLLSLTSVLSVIFPIVILFFLSAPGYICCILARKPFKTFEPEESEEYSEESEEEKEEAYRILREENTVGRVHPDSQESRETDEKEDVCGEEPLKEDALKEDA